MLVIAYGDERLELPVLVRRAELVPAVALHRVGAARLGDHVQVLAEGQDDRVVPLDALLQQRHVLLEAVRVLVRRLDRAHVPARELLIDEVGKRLGIEVHDCPLESSTCGVATG
jgi:hypothetical protein